MASVNPISASCQSIASTGHPSSSLGVGSPRTNTTTHYIHGTGSLGRIKYHYHKHKSLDASDEEFDLSQLSHSAHVLERVKSDRFLASKPDEDRRRRTIIVEKKNDSYGFTLQSYGIHYKKEQEVEMITYVDYVEYDGPAYRAGMREGDVILTINGTDMEKADHKTLVDFIKKCDSRMRMVVLFEDCVRKVELHMRYIQLQNVLQDKMNELERICLRERELLEGKWKTHSLPARKKATNSPSDIEYGLSPTDVELQNAPFYRPTFSTEDVTNITRHQSQQTIIPPPAQYMLTYHYLNPTYRYVLKPTTTTTNSSGEYFVALGDGIPHNPNSEQHFILPRGESLDKTTTTGTAQHYAQQQRKASGPPPVPPPRTCEKHKPPNQQQHQHAQLKQSDSKQKTEMKSQKSGRHFHGHSCNPCIGNFKWKSADKAAATSAAGNSAGGDNVSLDAYDLASPCCDTHCVPSRRRNRHHKEHTHKHKHRERDRESKERTPRPKSQSHASPSNARHVHHHHHGTGNGSVEAGQLHQHHHHAASQHHHHHHSITAQQQQHGYESKTGSLRSRYFDLTAGLASHCSLHSCTSSEFAAADSTSYTTSLSTDTLYWDPQSENAASRQHSTKSRQSYLHATQQQQQQYQHQHATQQQQQQQQQQKHQQEQQQLPPQQTPHQIQGVYQQRYHITATQIQPSQIYPNTTSYVNKPKSWDNLTTKAIGGYGFGYGYLDTVAMKPPIKLHIAQQRHSMPRKNHYGRYSTYTDVENYAPPPSQFVEELTTTTTTMITTTKSADDLLTSPITAQPACDCASKQQQQQLHQQQQQQPNQALNTKLNSCPGNSHLKFAHYNNCHAGYYSHLPRPTIDAATSTSSTTIIPTNNGTDVATISEVTRL